jgi:alpha-tubulin suppressor-like RCC1 family protein
MWGSGITEEGTLDPTGKAKSDSPVLVKGLEGTRVVQFSAGSCHYVALSCM